MIGELIRYCIQQIGYDGEAGTEVDRLHVFITDFHHHQSRHHAAPPQLIDDAYRAFVFRHLMAHPHVHVGSHVPGILPDQSAGRSSITRRKERGGKGSKSEHVTAPALEYDWVNILPPPHPHAHHTDLTHLQSLYGQDLRIVLSPHITRKMLIGSTDVNLTAPAYKCLQLVCRARENAIKSIHLGEKMRYDQKTIFYIAKKLIDAGLIAKIKAPETGTQASFFVAHTFLHKCPLYLRQLHAESSSDPTSSSSSSSTTATGASHTATSARVLDDDADADDDADPDADESQHPIGMDAPTVTIEEQQGIEDSDDPQYGRFELLSDDDTAVWLNSRTDLVRLRIYTLCAANSAQVVLRERLLNRIKLQSNQQRFRRSFKTILEKMVINGQMQVVNLLMSSTNKLDQISKKGLRITESGLAEMQALQSGQPVDPHQQERSALLQRKNAALQRELRFQQPNFIRELTLERRTHELIADAGTTGMTLRQLENALHATGNAKRTLEQIVLRSEEASGEPTLADMRVRQFHEYKGRERRIRMYSQHAWTLQAANEGFLDDAEKDALAQAGRLPTFDPLSFYSDAADAKAKLLRAFPDINAEKDVFATPGPSGSRPQPSVSGKKRGRPPGSKNKKTLLAEKASESAGRNSVGPADDEPDTPAQSAAKRRRINLERGPSLGLDDNPRPLRSSRLRSAALPEPTPEDRQPMAASSVEAGETPQGTDSPSATEAPAPSLPADLAVSTPIKVAIQKQGEIKPSPLATPDRTPRTNVTIVRSTNALVQCIQEAGSIIDSLSIPRELDAFVERSKFDTQVVNLREKRVRDRAINRAIDQGLLRRTFVRMETPDSHPQRTIVFLPDTDPALVQKFCDDVRQGAGGWRRPTDSISILSSTTGQVALQSSDVGTMHLFRPWKQDTKLDMAAFEADAELFDSMRAAFLIQEEPKKQHFGYPPGAATRLKIFHLACINLAAQQAHAESPSATVDISYFWTEAALDLFLALYPVRGAPQAVEQAYHNPTLRSLPLSQQDEAVRSELGIGADEKIGASLEVKTTISSFAEQLGSMRILQLSQEQPTSSSQRTLWNLPEYVPVYHWSAKGETKTRIQTCEVGLSTEHALEFWSKTQSLCLASAAFNPVIQEADEESAEFASLKASRSLVASICLKKAWRHNFPLRPTQQSFLARFLVPGQDPPANDDKLVNLASRICLAPTRVVKRFWRERAEIDANGTATRRVHVGWPIEIQGIELRSAEVRIERVRTISRQRDGRRTTLQKARELRLKRSQGFDNMLLEALDTHPAAAVLRDKIERALKSIRKRYVDLDPGFGVDETRRAIIRIVSSAAGEKPKFHHLKPPADTVTAAENGEREVSEVPSKNGAQRRPAATAATRERRKRSSRRSTVSTNFWTPQKNELLRDAAVILRARDRARGRTDWTALLQVLDSSDQTKARGFVLSQWRQQFARMRDVYGEEGYLNALERKWVAVHHDARSRGLLDDPKFPSATDFDLRQQIEYLRTHVDKDEVQASLERASDQAMLPLVLEGSDFTSDWVDEYPVPAAESKWDPFFSLDGGHVTRRFEMLLSAPLTVDVVSAPSPPVNEEEQIRRSLAESAVKMVIMTSNDQTSEEAMSAFCEQNDVAEIEAAVVRLIENKTIRPISAEVTQRRKPGTNFVFTDEYAKVLDLNLKAASGPASAEAAMQRSLAAMDAKIAAAGGEGAPPSLFVEPVTTDGEAAALVTLISEGLMHAELDTAPFANLRAHHAFNARILNDEEIETILAVSITPAGLDAARAASIAVPDPPVLSIATDTDAHLRPELDQAGVAGLPAAHFSLDEIEALVYRSRAPAFLTGTHELRIVSARFLNHHSVLTQPEARCLPRAWIDMHNRLLPHVWERALDTVAHLALSRPGISFTTLHARLAPALSAAETLDLVHTLCLTAKFELRPDRRALCTIHPTSRIWSGFHVL